MSTVQFKFSRFKLDKGRFTKALSDQVRAAMIRAGRSSYLDTYTQVPVWTGESRGALNALADAFGLPHEIVTPVEKKERFNRFTGELKTPDEGYSYAFVEGPARGAGNTISLTFSLRAEGFILGDKHELRNTSKAPFNFSLNFRALWRSRLEHELKLLDIPPMTYASRQRMY